MNAYQKIAFGGFAMLVVALLVTTVYNQTALFKLTAFAFIVFLLTLPATWSLIFLSAQAVGVVVGGIGHGVGIVGYMLSDWSEAQRRRLTASSVDQAEELEVPAFLDEALDRQNT